MAREKDNPWFDNMIDTNKVSTRVAREGTIKSHILSTLNRKVVVMAKTLNLHSNALWTVILAYTFNDSPTESIREKAAIEIASFRKYMEQFVRQYYDFYTSD